MADQQTDHTPHVEREDIRVKTRGKQPVLEVGDCEMILRTHFDGEPPEETEVDHYDRHPFYVIDFDDDENTDGLFEIEPEYVPPKETDDE